MSQFAVILPAAGKSTRFKDRRKKPFAEMGGRALWVRCAELFLSREDVCQTILVIQEQEREEFSRRFGANIAFMGVQVVNGGAERVDSISNALEHLKDSAEYVAIHDAVRPCTTKEEIEKVFDAATQSGAAILAAPVHDTLKKVSELKVEETVPRESLWCAQTPQVFRRDILLKAYAARSRVKGAITDDAQLVEAAGIDVTVVEGATTNIKVTTKRDIALAKAIVDSRPAPKPKQPLHPFAEDKMW